MVKHTMTKDEKRGQQIARKVLREMLNSNDHRKDIKQVAERYVESYKEGQYARKHVNLYCRQLVQALRKLI